MCVDVVVYCSVVETHGHFSGFHYYEQYSTHGRLRKEVRLDEVFFLVERSFFFTFGKLNLKEF